MKFVVVGQMFIKKKHRKFVKELAAASASRARELVYQKLGADHHIPRSSIEIASVEEMKA